MRNAVGDLRQHWAGSYGLKRNSWKVSTEKACLKSEKNINIFIILLANACYQVLFGSHKVLEEPFMAAVTAATKRWP